METSPPDNARPQSQTQNQTKAQPKSQNIRSLLLGGLLPLIAYTFVEEYFGILWGIAAGMALGVGEIVMEKRSQGKVSAITWGGNGAMIVLGAISFFTQEGVWFKLQPAILEAVMGAGLVGSYFLGKPFLVIMSEKQGSFSQVQAEVKPAMMRAMGTLTARLGIFFLANAGLAAWAAFYWSTRSWVILKGVGFTLGMFVYLGLEVLLLRSRIGKLVTKKS